jgi:hypothetical protein
MPAGASRLSVSFLFRNIQSDRQGVIEQVDLLGVLPNRHSCERKPFFWLEKNF